MSEFLKQYKELKILSLQMLARLQCVLENHGGSDPVGRDGQKSFPPGKILEVARN